MAKHLDVVGDAKVSSISMKDRQRIARLAKEEAKSGHTSGYETGRGGRRGPNVDRPSLRPGPDQSSDRLKRSPTPYRQPSKERRSATPQGVVKMVGDAEVLPYSQDQPPASLKKPWSERGPKGKSKGSKSQLPKGNDRDWRPYHARGKGAGKKG